MGVMTRMEEGVELDADEGVVVVEVERLMFPRDTGDIPPYTVSLRCVGCCTKSERGMALRERPCRRRLDGLRGDWRLPATAAMEMT